MGNASVSRKDEAGPSGEEEYMEASYHAPQQPFSEPAVLESSLHSLRTYPQVSETIQFQSNEAQQNASLAETRIPTVIKWCHDGHLVAIEGSWDNWKTREFLQQSDRELTILKMLPVGVYHYRFLVDGHWRYGPDLPQVRDEKGLIYNTLDLREHIEETEDNALESESSPLSSYNNEYFSLEDFEEKVPELPPLLLRTPLNQPQSSDFSQSDEQPLPSVLNHLFIHKQPRGEYTTALSSTQRFRKKYVTVKLYKSLKTL